MLNKDAQLANNIYSVDVEKKATRDGFGTGVVEAGKHNANVVVLSADLKESTRAEVFEKEFPERFIEVGVAEQNMATVASGLASAGKIPFITSYAAFSPGRNYEQIRTTAALNHQPVKICGMHAGVSVGPDGATHQMLEDMGLMRMLPGMTVLNPGDATEAHKAVMAAVETDGPVYIRFGRSGTPVFTTLASPFQIGKGLVLWKSLVPKIAILSTGSLSHTALLAARALEKHTGTIVVHIPTIKPLDTELILSVAKQVTGIVTVEEHQVAGGFGSAVAEYLSEVHPLPIKRLGIQDRFGQSGTPEELLTHYGLSASHIEESVRSLSKR